MKTHTLSWWKKKAKSTFQKFIRLRDSDDTGYGNCITCGKHIHWKKANGGHFIPAERLATCFVEHNCHLQCVHCNKWLHGKIDSYFVFMEKKYGRGTVDSLMKQKNLVTKFKYYEYQEIIGIYTDKINGLEIKKGLL